LVFPKDSWQCVGRKSQAEQGLRMHTLELYSIRVFDKNLAGLYTTRFCPLDKIRNNSLIDLVEGILKAHKNKPNDLYEKLKANKPHLTTIKQTKRTFTVEQIISTKDGVIYGLIQVGEYGRKQPIHNVTTGANTGQVNTGEAVMNSHFFMLTIKAGEKKGLLFLHAVSGKGLKTIFDAMIDEPFKTKTKGLKCRINPVANTAAVKKWMDEAEVCELRLSKFVTKQPLSDIYNTLNDSYQEVIVKPLGKDKRLGKLSKFSDKSMVEFYKKEASSVKVQVEYNGRKRVFKLGSTDPISSIELTKDDVELKWLNEDPTFNSLVKFSTSLTKDMWTTI
jgi:hypothetical protein